MKNFRRVVAALLSSIMLISCVACSSKEEETTVDGQSSNVTSVSGTDFTVATSAEPTETAFDITQYTFDDLYGSQFPAYANHQYYFDGETVSMAESNFYFVNAFRSFTQSAMYGAYPLTDEGYFDLSAPIEMEDEEIEYETYGDIFVEYAEAMLESTCILCKLAEEEGITLSEDTIAMIDQMIEELKGQPELPTDYTLDQYLQLYYGEPCTEEAFREVMQRYYLADLYTSEYVKNHELTEEEKALVTVPAIRYAVFLSPAGSTTDEDKASAEELANALLEACDGSIDNFAILGPESYNKGECLEYGELAVPKGKTVSAFENWAWDESRVEGDMDIIYADEYGYFVVGYIGTMEDEDAKVELLGDYVTSLSETEGYSLTTNDPFVPAEPVSSETTVDETLPPETTTAAISEESTEPTTES